MSEVNNTAAPVTTEQIQEMISTAIAGYATKSEKNFNKFTESFSTQLKELTTPKQPEGNKATEGQTADPKIAAMERNIAELTQLHKAAEEKALKAEQKQALSEALGTFTFASDKAREVAAQMLESQMERSQDGKYFIGDRDLKTAVAEQMKELPGLLAPMNVGSSGATGTKQSVNRGLEGLIKPQMTKDEIAQAYQEFGRMFGNR